MVGVSRQGLLLQEVNPACKQLGQVLLRLGGAVCAAEHIRWTRPPMGLHAVLPLQHHALVCNTKQLQCMLLQQQHLGRS